VKNHLDFSLEILVLCMSSAIDPKELVSYFFNECQDLVLKLHTVKEHKEVLIELDMADVVEEQEEIPIELNMVYMMEEGEKILIELDTMDTVVECEKIPIKLDVAKENEKPPPILKF
jgi:hypothetical protein